MDNKNNPTQSTSDDTSSLRTQDGDDKSMIGLALLGSVNTELVKPELSTDNI